MCNCQGHSTSGPAAPGVGATPGLVPPVVAPEVPLAERIPIVDEGPEGAPPGPVPIRPCRNSFRSGCYVLNFTPIDGGRRRYEGTMRVDRSAPDGGPDNIIVSGDLYLRRIAFPIPDAEQPATESTAAAASRPATDENGRPIPILRPRIPIFPRSRYHSYLQAVRVTASANRPCTVTLVVEQFDYTQPAAGTFKGSFPATASRTVTLKLTQVPAVFPFTGPHLVGRWIENGTDKGAVTLSWVSSFFRRASVEIDVLEGAVAPQPVPDGAGGTEYFDTIYAKHGWQLSVISDQVGVPVPAGVDPTACWNTGALHNLMTTSHQPADLDTDWRIHLMFVPARLGCGRGVMYDQIDVPREGCASFCDDGYPLSETANFGAAGDQHQRDVPRAFLRSATHEITHTFNQIHQEQETAADNSIMTTTGSVANVLGGPTTGQPGIFPDQINLAVNTTVRHHLVHMPDPVIRPGGWPFASWFGSGVPQASDHNLFDPSELELTVTAPATVAFGQPYEVGWTLTNRSDGPLIVPDDVSLEALFATITITDAEGVAHPFRPFVIVCDNARLAELAPGESVSATHRVFWSSDGFAFPQPGSYRLTVAVTWSASGVPVGVVADPQVFVQFPVNSVDNDAAGLVLNPEVGKWVALGGNAYHLTEATSRLRQLADSGGSADALADNRPAPSLLAGFEGLLPDREG
ncbi:hypothetical protein JIG36_15860 [Actinoplanes sp. LDG1-06]|uniref:Uncharacterized protein n=1 Tax=Paractinoplanes ovalisporus TaxID=2810368 RepID=A0ABS2ACF4_9ACTN|nr:hypothetical protein [Actinoplanes ovalisporus]MBM2617033.1 hypothetical protein [Actinoplanes ovalisporus]